MSTMQTHIICVEVWDEIFVFKIFKVTQTELECGPMPNLMVALPNIAAALCSTPQSLADAHY